MWLMAGRVNAFPSHPRSYTSIQSYKQATNNGYVKLLTCIRTRLGRYPGSWNESRGVVVQYAVVEMTVSH